MPIGTAEGVVRKRLRSAADCSVENCAEVALPVISRTPAAWAIGATTRICALVRGPTKTRTSGFSKSAEAFVRKKAPTSP